MLRLLRTLFVKLLIFAKSAPYRCCQQRRELAQELLKIPARCLEGSAEHMLANFKQDVEVAASNGTVSQQLFGLVDIWAKKWPSTTVEIESTNKLVRNCVVAAPNVGLPIVSARACTLKRLGRGFKGASNKWSDVRPCHDALLEEATQSQRAADEVANMPDRWIPLIAPEFAKESLQQDVPRQLKIPSYAWAARLQQTYAGTMLGVPS